MCLAFVLNMDVYLQCSLYSFACLFVIHPRVLFVIICIVMFEIVTMKEKALVQKGNVCVHTRVH